MKKNRILPLIILIVFPLISFGFNNEVDGFRDIIQTNVTIEEPGLKIYPNPVRENKFTVSAEKEIKEIRMQNILGQKINIGLTKLSQKKYSVILKERKKGIHLVTVIFNDNSKLVQRIVVN